MLYNDGQEMEIWMAIMQVSNIGEKNNMGKRYEKNGTIKTDESNSHAVAYISQKDAMMSSMIS